MKKSPVYSNPCFWALAAGACVSLTGLAADFAPVFTSGAVLQRDQPIAVWGRGRDGESVTVELLDKKVTTTVREGRWKVELPAQGAKENTTLILTGDNVVELTDIAIGEVWIGAGQSNMEYRLNQCPPYADLLANANDLGVRQIKIPHLSYPEAPVPAFNWKHFDRAAAGEFGAVAYFFAAELHRKLGVVVGIVNCSYGGTPIEAWMSREAISKAGLDSILQEDDKKMASFPNKEAYEAAWKEFDTQRIDRAAREKAAVPVAELGAPPVEPYGYRLKWRPTGLYESMLRLVTPYSAKGVLWYHGENNASRPQEYARLLPQIITNWRQAWNQPEWPFFIAQISSSNGKNYDMEGWATFREVQRVVATTTPHSGWVVTLDYGEAAEVHPKVKKPIGERFAKLALTRVYGERGAAQSASASVATLKRNEIVVSFTDLPGTLKLQDPALPTLEVQGEVGAWAPAKGKIAPDGKTLSVVVPNTADKPKAIRYAWRQFCTLSLYSDEGLPVSPWNVAVTVAP
jgi:sialate O-acetylesterase